MSDVQVGRTWVSEPTPPLSRLMLALYCGASGDHNPLHVDVDAAREAGFDDVIGHGMLSMAYLGRFLTEVFGQEALQHFEVRFTSMTHVGDALISSATCTSVDQQAGVSTLSLRVATPDGSIKATGEAVVRARIAIHPCSGNPTSNSIR